MSSPTWQDRRGMFQPGKHVHEPSRKMSIPKAADAPKTTTSPAKSTDNSTTTNAVGGGGPAAGRRRSSASSQAGMFGKLLANRSSEEHAQRRQSWDEMKKPEGLSAFFSGLVNKPADK